MAFDFKKEYKEFYMPKNKPEIVNVPKANYIAVRGKGNGQGHQQAPDAPANGKHPVRRTWQGRHRHRNKEGRRTCRQIK